ncbi:MAG: hypothetical protein LC655_02010, partial [Bacteroidales bacterium]|nr:hypothetical protein [Bacteroidales bacterium]
MEVLPAKILNNLTIAGNSQFRANGLDLYLGGNFTNNNTSGLPGISNGGFIPGSESQTLRFNGSNKQLVSGIGTNLPNFANLTVNSLDTVALQSNTAIRVDADLTLESGVLADGSNTILVTGNIINTASHSSSTGNGGIELGGTEVQNISGIGGSFGNIILNNPSGAILQDNITLNGKLTFSSGSIYIDDYLLTFGLQSEINGTPGAGSMIILNGALSDQGVRKLFPAGAADFTMPIGVPGKYTPASFSITQNALPGSITVYPVDRRHPAVVDPAPTELNFYWSVDSTGFGIPFSVDQTYSYLEEDVQPNSTSDATYVVGHYLNDNYDWSDLGDAGSPGSVNEGLRTITITGGNFVTGDYTAGEPDNFTPPLDIFYSRNDPPSNEWTDPAAWSTDSHAGPAATYAPIGNPII